MSLTFNAPIPDAPESPPKSTEDLLVQAAKLSPSVREELLPLLKAEPGFAHASEVLDMFLTQREEEPSEELLKAIGNSEDRRTITSIFLLCTRPTNPPPHFTQARERVNHLLKGVSRYVDQHGLAPRRE